MGGFFGGERPNEPRYRWRGSCPAGDVPEASVGSGSWFGIVGALVATHNHYIVHEPCAARQFGVRIRLPPRLNCACYRATLEDLEGGMENGNSLRVPNLVNLHV